MEFMKELKCIADKVIEMTCNSPAEKELLNNQLMFLAMAVNTKEEYIDAIVSCYKSKGITLKII